MSAASDAYAAAERLIAEAKADGRDELNFNSEDFRALETLPPDIGELTELRRLSCDNTALTDLSPLFPIAEQLTQLWLDKTNLTEFEQLARFLNVEAMSLSGTSVSDLGPLSGLVGLSELYLDSTSVSDLGPLSGLVGLFTLTLNDTSVSDLGPLSGLIGLSLLYLDGTSVSDLRPVLSHPKLLEKGHFNGVYFTRTEATKHDPRIAEIAEIVNDQKRAQALFDHLKTLPPYPDPLPSPPYPTQEVPEPDALVQVEVQGEKLELDPASPTQAEREERLKHILHDRLRTQTKELCNKAGNQFFRLSARARALDGQVDRDFEDLDLLMLHLAIDDIREMAALGREDDESGPFPPEVTIALSDVLATGPGLTLGHPDVDLLVERANKRRSAGMPSEQELQAQDRLSEEIAKDNVAIGERLQALEAQVAGSDHAEAKVTQTAANRNVLIQVGVISSVATSVVTEATTGVVVDGLKAAIVHMMSTYGVAILDVANLYGSVFANWFTTSVSQLPDLPAVVRSKLSEKKQKR